MGKECQLMVAKILKGGILKTTDLILMIIFLL